MAGFAIRTQMGESTERGKAETWGLPEVCSQEGTSLFHVLDGPVGCTRRKRFKMGDGRGRWLGIVAKL